MLQDINATPQVIIHQGDLPSSFDPCKTAAIDTETMGLSLTRDRLCLVQLMGDDGQVHLIQMNKQINAPNLSKILTNPQITKLFHFGRFDIAMLYRHLGVVTAPVYCTKIASKLVRTYTDRHGLKDLCRDLLGVELSKQQQTTDWGADSLTPAQMTYAASDVIHLPVLMARLDHMLAREGRMQLAKSCFDFLPTRAILDLLSFNEPDVFAH